MELNNRTLAVEYHGEGEAVVMVHGLGGTSNVWHPQATILQRYFRVVRPDLAGSGRSPCDVTLTIGDYVHDLAGILDREKISNAHFVGHSMGAIICQHFAAMHATRVNSLVLVGAVHAPSERVRGIIRDRAHKARQEGMIGIADGTVTTATSKRTQAAQPGVVAAIREMVMRQNAQSYANTCESLAAAQPAELAAITCRTLLITGDEDIVAPPAAARHLAKTIARAQMHILSNCGHWAPLECPDELNRLLLEFYFSTDT